MRKKLLMTLAMVCLILFASSVAEAQLKTITVAPCEFQPESQQAEQLDMPGGVYICRQLTSTENWHYAQAHVPDGVIIRGIRLHYYDNNADHDIGATLALVNKYNAQWKAIYWTGSSGASPSNRSSVSMTPLTNPAITLTNTAVNNYFIEISLGAPKAEGDSRVYGITIYYD